MTDTRDKLLEAKYFLERMRETESDRDPFRYNLSAFLSAARSITWFMQKEYSKAPGFKDYYAEKQCEMRHDKIMGYLNKLRVATIHREPVQPVGHGTDILDGRVAIIRNGLPEATHTEIPIEKGQSESPIEDGEAETGTGEWYFRHLPEALKQLSDIPIITICEEHIAKLERLVTECESRFPTAAFRHR